jgi:hypothetical protein
LIIEARLGTEQLLYTGKTGRGLGFECQCRNKTLLKFVEKTLMRLALVRYCPPEW